MRVTRVAVVLTVAFASFSSCTHEDRAADADGGGGNRTQDIVGTRISTNLDGLNNVYRFAPDVYGGSAPATDEAFAALASMGDAGQGIATIVSVDGAEPDLARANAHQMRYVHVPIGYDGIKPADLAQLAAVMRDLPRPIYVHCHHGRHRGPAAIAAGLAAIGEITPDQGVALMQMAGTSDAYPGLFRVVAESAVLDPPQIDEGLIGLTERKTVSGFVASMAQIDRAFDRLTLTRAANWGPPQRHPDLAPAAEAAIIHDLFANLADAPDARFEPADFRALLAQAVTAADRLERGLLQPQARAEHEQNYQRLKQTCTDCHLQYRDGS